MQYDFKAIFSSYNPQELFIVNSIPSSVLIPLFITKEDVYILFTKRSNKVKDHKGQISFPGGVKEPDDKNLLETALRETEEEIGISSKQIEIVGRIDDYYTITNYTISTFVGVIYDSYKGKYNKEEIEKILIYPLKKFFDRSIHKATINNKNNILYSYELDNENIWGATASILHNFLTIVENFKIEN